MTGNLVRKHSPEAGVTILTFNRPDKLNALSTPLLREFEGHLEDVAADPDTRAVILTGAGDRAFIAGADIAEYHGQDVAAFIAYQSESRRIFCRLETLPKPVIAAVRGYALGGGFEIALCCDIILCAKSARLGLPEGLLGLSPGGGGTQRLTRAVGKYMASDIMLAARRIRGERAYELGLAAECVDDDMLMDAALERARALARVAPGACSTMKELIRTAPDVSLDNGLTLEQEALYRLYESDDAREGIDAFLEKREPKFRGR